LQVKVAGEILSLCFRRGIRVFGLNGRLWVTNGQTVSQIVRVPWDRVPCELHHHLPDRLLLLFWSEHIGIRYASLQTISAFEPTLRLICRRCASLEVLAGMPVKKRGPGKPGPQSGRKPQLAMSENAA
jgi:hypothetical protein